MSQYTNYYNQLCDGINEEYERRKRQESKAATKLYENTEHQILNGGVKGQKEVKQLFSYWTVVLDCLDIFVFEEIITYSTHYCDTTMAIHEI